MNPESTHKNVNNTFYDVIIAGGGLAGLICSIALSRKGFKILLLERKNYPFHKVCGEYVSNEILDFFYSLGFDPFSHNASRIDRLRISAPSGKNIFVDLDMGGFGISRFTMDQALSLIALKSGALVLENCRVNDITYSGDSFTVSSSSGVFQSRFVIGSYGKRDILDKKLNRQFIRKHTRYMGVKYHIKLDYPVNEIGLDNFRGGYCGIVKIEDEKYNLCYLYRRKETDDFKNIRELEENILFSNPIIRNIFEKAVFLNEQPEVINEISFDKKTCIEDHIFLCGDAAGLITPLCGNGMAMAVHGAKILSDTIINIAPPGGIVNTQQRLRIENIYKNKWKAAFSSRLFWGRNLQEISGNALLTSASLNIIHSMPSFEKWLISKTHGKKII